jgi:hypothetical protein
MKTKTYSGTDTCLGCLTVVVVLVVLLIVVFVVPWGGGDDAGAATASVVTPTVVVPTATAVPKPTATAVRKPTATVMPTATPLPKTGTPVAKGNWRYTVGDVSRANTLPGSRSDKAETAKGIFLVVPIQLVNLGKTNFSINSWDFHLYADNDVQYATDIETDYLCWNLEDKGCVALGDAIPPGISVVTVLVFDINPNAKGLRLHLDQPNIDIDLAQ